MENSGTRSDSIIEKLHYTRGHPGQDAFPPYRRLIIPLCWRNECSWQAAILQMTYVGLARSSAWSSVTYDSFM